VSQNAFGNVAAKFCNLFPGGGALTRAFEFYVLKRDERFHDFRYCFHIVGASGPWRRLALTGRIAELVQLRCLFARAELPSDAEKFLYPGFSYQVLQGVSIKHAVKSMGGFSKDAFQPARRDNDARFIATAHAIDHRFISFGGTDDMADDELSRVLSEAETATDAAARGKELLLGKLVNDLGEVIAGDLVSVCDFVDGGECRATQRRVHQHAQSVVGENAESHPRSSIQ